MCKPKPQELNSLTQAVAETCGDDPEIVRERLEEVREQAHHDLVDALRADGLTHRREEESTPPQSSPFPYVSTLGQIFPEDPDNEQPEWVA